MVYCPWQIEDPCSVSMSLALNEVSDRCSLVYTNRIVVSGNSQAIQRIYGWIYEWIIGLIVSDLRRGALSKIH